MDESVREYVYQPGFPFPGVSTEAETGTYPMRTSTSTTHRETYIRKDGRWVVRWITKEGS